MPEAELTPLPGDSLIALHEKIQEAIRAVDFPQLVEEEVTDDGETYMALRCPRCDSIVSDGDLSAVSPAEQWAPNEYPDDDAFDHRRLTFDGSDRPDLEETLYYKHGDPGHAVSLPDGWTENWT